MKYIVATLAVLLFASTFAVAEGYQPLPFPQAANTALASASTGGQSSVTAEMPASMATNQSQQSDRGGSPFPSAANPSRAISSDQSTPSREHQHDLGSPFPSEANPSR